MKTKIKKCIPIYVMLLPGFLYLLINNYLPMGGLVMAFKNVNWQKGIWGSDWAGLKNFEYLLKHRTLLILQEIQFVIISHLLLSIWWSRCCLPFCSAKLGVSWPLNAIRR